MKSSSAPAAGHLAGSSAASRNAPDGAVDLQPGAGAKARGGLSHKIGDSRLGDYLLVLPAAIFILATVLYPIVYTVNLSLYDVDIKNFLAGNAPFIGLENYRQTLADAAFQRALIVSLTYTAASLALTFIGGLALALLFNRTFLGANTLRALILLAWILPSVVSGNIWRWLLDGSNGIVNFVLIQLRLLGRPVFWLTESETAMSGVVLATAWTSIPFAMVLLLAGLQGIPGSLYEAASLDGARPWRRFWDITLPMMRPVILVVLLLNFIYTFKTFDTVFIMTGGGPGDATTVLPIFAYTVGFSFFKLGEGAVATTLLLIIPLVLSLVYFRVSRGEESA
ncbi:MAG: sugar ABC transporter permease [Thermomicrobiales bacterium]|nr:sugar ABC transporter permease [Thermomicrobiales bacterium]